MKTMKTPEQWYQCMDAGIAAVRRPYEIRRFRRRGLPRITLYHLPSFQDCVGWTVYQLPHKEGHLLQSITWRQSVDGKRMEDLMCGRTPSTSAEPTLTETTNPLDSIWFEHQLTALSSIRISLHTNRPLGLDGETFGVHARNEFDVEWWCHGPPEWADLVQWAHKCIKYFCQSTVV